MSGLVWQQWTLIAMFLLAELVDIGSIGDKEDRKPGDVVVRTLGRLVMGALVLTI